MTLPPDLEPFSLLPIEIEARLDQRTLSIRELIELRPGSLLKLERSAGDHIDIVAGGTVLGYGEVVVVENAVGIRVTNFREEF